MLAIQPQNIVRRILIVLVCGASVLGVLSVSSAFSAARSGSGVAADFFWRILLIPFLVSVALAVLCDPRQSVDLTPFAFGPLLAFVASTHSIRPLMGWREVPFWLLAAGASLIGARLARDLMEWTHPGSSGKR